jgi:hypothetical protein
MFTSTARRDRNMVQQDSQCSSTTNGKHTTANCKTVRTCGKGTCTGASPDEEERNDNDSVAKKATPPNLRAQNNNDAEAEEATPPNLRAQNDNDTEAEEAIPPNLRAQNDNDTEAEEATPPNLRAQNDNDAKAEEATLPNLRAQSIANQSWWKTGMRFDVLERWTARHRQKML